jgi:aminotransferase in exopolysaccharide biosynthesis
MIPLSTPHLNGNELKYVSECIETDWVSSAGKYVSRFEQMVADYSGNDFGVATVNGTSGLHLCLHMLGLNREDAILLSNITFVASANAAAYTNAEPVFIDIDPRTWQMDLNLVEEYLDMQTVQKDGKCIIKESRKHLKVIMPVHVLGNMCNMPHLMEIADKHNIEVVEDASESLGSTWNGTHSGSWGIMSVFSFNGNKIITTGGGGVIVTNNKKHAKRAKHLSTQAKLNPETYYHDEVGFNYRLVNVLAAIGVGQMEQLDDFLKKKCSIDAFYRDNLKEVGDIKFQEVPAEVNPNCWLFTFYTNYTNKKNEILNALRENGIIARPLWTPMNQLPLFEDSTYYQKNDYSRDIHAHCLSIPSSVNLTEEQMEKVIRVIKGVY